MHNAPSTFRKPSAGSLAITMSRLDRLCHGLPTLNPALTRGRDHNVPHHGLRHAGPSVPKLGTSLMPPAHISSSFGRKLTSKPMQAAQTASRFMKRAPSSRGIQPSGSRPVSTSVRGETGTTKRPAARLHKVRPEEVKALLTKIVHSPKGLSSALGFVQKHRQLQGSASKPVIKINGETCKVKPKRSSSTLKPVTDGRDQSRDKSAAPKLSDFEFLATIGVGCFGKVRLAKWVASLDRPCAVKIVTKEYATKLRQTEHLFHERELLLSLDNPFIVKWYGQDHTA